MTVMENWYESQADEIVSICGVDPDELGDHNFKEIERILELAYHKGLKADNSETVLLNKELAKSNQQILDLVFEIERLKRGNK